MTMKPEVAYADVFFGTDERGHVTVVKAYCVYEFCENLTCEREVNDLKIYKERDKRGNGEPEYYTMESEDSEDEGDDDTLEEDYDLDRSKNDSGFQLGETFEDTRSNSSSQTDTTKEYSTDHISEEVKPLMLANDIKQPIRPQDRNPETLTVVGMTVVAEDKMLVVTETGEFIIFDAQAKFLFLREFNEIHQDLTTIDSCSVAATSGYCIKFYRVKENNILELKDRLIDFEYAGCTTVHGLHFFQEKLLVTCNIQSVYVSATPSVKILDLKGNVRQTIELPGFKAPAKITCSRTGKFIFVCDFELNRVSCMKCDGRILWEKTEKAKPLDLELVNDSEIFVLCENGNIKGLSAATGKLRSLAEVCQPMNASPGRLCCQQKKRKLFFCLEKLVVGSSDFILPLSVKKAKGQLDI